MYFLEGLVIVVYLVVVWFFFRFIRPASVADARDKVLLVCGHVDVTTKWTLYFSRLELALAYTQQ